jgi:hypothetical protein
MRRRGQATPRPAITCRHSCSAQCAARPNFVAAAAPNLLALYLSMNIVVRGFSPPWQ